MKKLILALFTILVISISAQQKPFAIEVGSNHSWFTYEIDVINELEEDFKPMFNFGVRYNITEFYGFNLSVGLRYFALERALTVDWLPYNGRTMEINNYLISAPIQFSYSFDVLNTSVIINLEPAYNFKTTVIDISPFALQSADLTERDVSDQMKKIQLAIGAGLEFNFDLFSQSFGLKSIYNYYLTDIPKSDRFTRDGNQQYSWAPFKAQEISVVLSYYF